jgi:hypothetical protein
VVPPRGYLINPNYSTASSQEWFENDSKTSLT